MVQWFPSQAGGYVCVMYIYSQMNILAGKGRAHEFWMNMNCCYSINMLLTKKLLLQVKLQDS